MRHSSKLWLCAVTIMAAMLSDSGSADHPDRAPPLSPQEQAALDHLLAAWVARSAAVQTWSCTFSKWEYDDVWGPVGADGKKLPSKECTGTLKYCAPNKWLYQEEESKQWDSYGNEFKVIGRDPCEHWIYDGESLYQLDHANRVLKETRLPPESRDKRIADRPLSWFCGGKAITDWLARLVSPGWQIDHYRMLMPLGLGDSAESITARYRIRIVTPPECRNQIWLEAMARSEVHTACISRVDLMLESRSFELIAIRVWYPGGKQRDIYQFESTPELNDRSNGFFCDIARPATPAGYKYIFEDSGSFVVASAAESPSCKLLSSREKCSPVGRETLFCKAKRPRLGAATMLKSRAVSRRSPCCAQSRQASVSDGGRPRRRARYR